MTENKQQLAMINVIRHVNDQGVCIEFGSHRVILGWGYLNLLWFGVAAIIVGVLDLIGVI